MIADDKKWEKSLHLRAWNLVLILFLFFLRKKSSRAHKTSNTCSAWLCLKVFLALTIVGGVFVLSVASVWLTSQISDLQSRLASSEYVQSFDLTKRTLWKCIGFWHLLFALWNTVETLSFTFNANLIVICLVTCSVISNYVASICSVKCRDHLSICVFATLVHYVI